METQAKLIALAVFVSTLASPLVHAQTAAGPGGDPAVALQGPDGGAPRPGGPGRKHAGHGPGRPDRAMDQGPGRNHRPGGLTSLTTVSGTVGQLVGNDDAILDGFTLNTGSGPATTVKFPPHLGEQVQKAIKAGSTVSVTGYVETPPTGEARFRMNSLTAGKTTVVDSPPVRPETPPAAPA